MQSVVVPGIRALSSSVVAKQVGRQWSHHRLLVPTTTNSLRRFASSFSRTTTSALAATMSTTLPEERQSSSLMSLLAAVAATATAASLFLASSNTSATKCDAASPTNKDNDHFTPASVAKENFQDVVNAHDVDAMPVYTADQVAEHNGTNGTSIWMTYGGVVYDVTDFIQNHPGGSEKIMMAAGSAIEPFWYVDTERTTTATLQNVYKTGV